MIDLTEEQIKRYSRHILLQDVGLEGQEKLRALAVIYIFSHCRFLSEGGACRQA